MRRDIGLAALLGVGLFMASRRLYAEEIAPGDYARPAEGQGMTNEPDNLPNTRGFRNKNPGNIEYNAANDWDGQTGSDGRYAIFSDMRYGIRAIGKLLDAYYYRHGLTTLSGIINRWAPDHENNTASYISHAATLTGLDPDSALDLETAKPAIVAAIIHHENGSQPFSGRYITEALAL